MKKYINILSVATAAICLFCSCEKKIESIDTYSVNVEYKSSGSKYLVGDVTLNPKDSIYFDFTITADEDISYVELQKNGARVDTFWLPASNKRSFSKVKGYIADSIAGDYNYRVVGRTNVNRFLGDGGKSIKVTIRPDFIFWSYRLLKVPDTVAKVNKCYYAVTTGNTYNYSEGAANSAQIDFGYYCDTTGIGTAVITDDLKHTFYALNAPQPQIGYYDISTWTKNATVFKVITGVNFVTALTSGGAINTLIKNNMTSGTANKVNKLDAGSVVGFKTAAGKYGAIQLRYANQNSPAKETEIQVDVKIQM
jgi:hypothetical protein